MLTIVPPYARLFPGCARGGPYAENERMTLQLDQLLHGYDKNLRPGFGGKIPALLLNKKNKHF